MSQYPLEERGTGHPSISSLWSKRQRLQAQDEALVISIFPYYSLNTLGLTLTRMGELGVTECGPSTHACLLLVTRKEHTDEAQPAAEVKR